MNRSGYTPLCSRGEGEDGHVPLQVVEDRFQITEFDGIFTIPFGMEGEPRIHVYNDSIAAILELYDSFDEESFLSFKTVEKIVKLLSERSWTALAYKFPEAFDSESAVPNEFGSPYYRTLEERVPNNAIFGLFQEFHLVGEKFYFPLQHD